MRFLMRDRKYPKCSDVLLLCELSAKQSTYLPKADVAEYIREGQLLKFKYSYEDDKEI